MKLALACLAVCACSGPQRLEISLRSSPQQHVLAGADTVTLSLRDGSDRPLVARTVGADSTNLSLDSVSGGANYQVTLEATTGTTVIARGRTCRFALGPATHTVPLYLALVGDFAPVVVEPRLGSGATVFLDGTTARIVGGAQLSTAAYDLPSGRFVDGPDLQTPRSGCLATTLEDGAVLLLGGTSTNFGIELVEDGQTSILAANFPGDWRDGAAVLLSDGRTIAMGGRREAGGALDTALAILGRSVDLQPVGNLLHARVRFTATRLGNSPTAPVLVVGGTGASGPVGELELFSPGPDTFSAVAGTALQIPRSGHTATRLPDGRVLVVGGIDADGQPTAVVEAYDPVTQTMQVIDHLHLARSNHAAVLLNDGRVLVTGGVGADGKAHADSELFDPASGAQGAFISTEPLAMPRAGHGMVGLCDGTFLVAGGEASAEIYTPFR